MVQGALIARDGRIWLLALAVPHTDQARRAGLRACKETPVRMRCDARHVFGVPKEEALQSVLAVLHNDNLGSVVDSVESVVEACVAMPVVPVAAVHRVELKLLHRRRRGCLAACAAIEKHAQFLVEACNDANPKYLTADSKIMPKLLPPSSSPPLLPDVC